MSEPNMLVIAETDIPDDVGPPTSDESETGWYDATYPYSTEEHPYGYFNKQNSNEPDFDRPRKRRPHGRGITGARSGVGVSDKSARTAAVMLGRLNTFIGFGLHAFGMPMTREALLAANEQFEQMAYEALLTDPKLCKKILSAGASSGQAQLTMAYLMLGGSIAPIAFSEVKTNRQTKEGETDDTLY